MRSFLLQPYPFTENPYRKLALCAGIGLFVALFLGVFKPFGFDNLPATTAWRHALFYGGVTFIVSAFFQLVAPLLFPALFREEGWRSWKEILYLLTTTAAVGGGNFLLALRLYSQSGSLQGFLWAELMTMQIGVFPILFVVFLKQMKFYRRFAAEAAAVTEDMTETKKKEDEAQGFFLAEEFVSQKSAASTSRTPVSVEESKPVLVLRGDNQKEELSVSSDDLLYIASADNYVNVRYREAGKEKSALLRGSLKGFEERLSGYKTFFRCHRMYIVNLQAVKGVSGNAQGLKLHLTGTGDAIPVSRSLTEAVKEKLHVSSRSHLAVNGQQAMSNRQ